jgi:hypothetical protein
VHYRVQRCRCGGATRGVAVIVASTLSSWRRATSFLMCIESDGVAANFSARQQLVRSACRERNEPHAKARSDANSGLDGGSAIFRHSKLESATGNWNLGLL